MASQSRTLRQIGCDVLTPELLDGVLSYEGDLACNIVKSCRWIPTLALRRKSASSIHGVTTSNLKKKAAWPSNRQNPEVDRLKTQRHKNFKPYSTVLCCIFENHSSRYGRHNFRPMKSKWQVNSVIVLILYYTHRSGTLTFLKPSGNFTYDKV
jgi:hypothetical protein